MVLQVLPLKGEIGNGSSVSFEEVEGFAEVLFLGLCGLKIGSNFCRDFVQRRRHFCEKKLEGEAMPGQTVPGICAATEELLSSI